MNYIELQIIKAKRRRLIKKGAIILLLLILAGFAVIGVLSLTKPLAGDIDIAVVRIEGTMVSGLAQSGGYVGSEYVGGQIRRAADDPLIRAIVLRIDSGGGTPTAAQEIIRDILYAREKKPVVVSMGSIATSAAYYVSAYADRIYSSPDTFTGGIGVIWVFFDRSEQFDREGIGVEVVKSGEMKDMTHSYRNLSQDEVDLAQGLVDASLNRFIEDISSQRNITRESIDDARLIRGEDALTLGLVDELGNLQDAIAGARVIARAR
ncbi:signal peptide peptidase SppA [Methanocalculus sp.]|uniref:signal peptide peptidase SppA n=1 Tax=Methanocalculus sp. TaxID=2004547 RepID=UPI002721F9FD|nr:signal peptide peptidase SppA [Methanocalculus sp.]MDO8841823.1 signal peptide peptidase SppA [Methanocalculus sp.]